MGISNFGMPHWFVLTLLLLFRSCEGFHFNVTRVIHGDRRDLFTNVDPLGKCPRRNDNGRQWCLDRNGDCSNRGCCICSCTYSHSTFQMGSSPKTATCVENSSFRTFAGKGFAIFTLRAVVSPGRMLRSYSGQFYHLSLFGSTAGLFILMTIIFPLFCENRRSWGKF